MIVSSSVNTRRYQRPTNEGSVVIEFAITKDGGNSSAGEKFSFQEQSVRLAWRLPNGGFDPISSAELPNWAVMDVIEACAENGFFSNHQAAQLINSLSASIVKSTDGNNV